MSAKQNRDRRIVAWMHIAVGDDEHDLYRHEQEVYWGVFVVDASDTQPIAMFSDEADADQYALILIHRGTNTEYAVSPCVVDIMHRDNFEVPE